jgi:hypothetical protein
LEPQALAIEKHMVDARAANGLARYWRDTTKASF